MSWLRLSREEVDLIARKDKHIRSSRRCLDAFPGEGQSRQHTLLRGEAVAEPTSVCGTGRTFKTADHVEVTGCGEKAMSGRRRRGRSPRIAIARNLTLGESQPTVWRR